MTDSEDWMERKIREIAEELNIPYEIVHSSVELIVVNYGRPVSWSYKSPRTIYNKQKLDRELVETHGVDFDGETKLEYFQKLPHEHDVACTFGSPTCPGFGIAYIDAPDKGRTPGIISMILFLAVCLLTIYLVFHGL